MRSRNLYGPLVYRAPTLQGIAEDNPDEDAEAVCHTFDSIMDDRRQCFSTVADNLPRVVKYSSLSMQQQLRLNELSAAGNGLELYVMIGKLVDITSGRVQDKLRVKFDEVKVHPTD